MVNENWWAEFWSLLRTPEWTAVFIQSLISTLLATAAAALVAIFVLRRQLQHDRQLVSQQMKTEQDRHRADARREAAVNLARAVRAAEQDLRTRLGDPKAFQSDLVSEFLSVFQTSPNYFTPVFSWRTRYSGFEAGFSELPVNLDMWPGGRDLVSELEVAETQLGRLEGVRDSIQRLAITCRAILICDLGSSRVRIAPIFLEFHPAKLVKFLLSAAWHLATKDATNMGQYSEGRLSRRMGSIIPFDYVPQDVWLRLFRSQFQEFHDIADALAKWNGYLPLPPVLIESKATMDLPETVASLERALQIEVENFLETVAGAIRHRHLPQSLPNASN